MFVVFCKLDYGQICYLNVTAVATVGTDGQEVYGYGTDEGDTRRTRRLFADEHMIIKQCQNIV